MINLIMLLLTIFAGGFQFGDGEPNNHGNNQNAQVCITAERITRPIHSWRVLNTEILYKNKISYMKVTVHNPVNTKNLMSIDAGFILRIDPASPSDPQKYSLIAAIYFNTKINVIFKRIYEIRQVTINNKLKKFPIQTPCFSRELVQIINFSP